MTRGERFCMISAAFSDADFETLFDWLTRRGKKKDRHRGARGLISGGTGGRRHYLHGRARIEVVTQCCSEPDARLPAALDLKDPVLRDAQSAGELRLRDSPMPAGGRSDFAARVSSHALP
jgi:hypothetical protein